MKINEIPASERGNLLFCIQRSSMSKGHDTLGSAAFTLLVLLLPPELLLCPIEICQ